jgi:hypothetical protein
MASKTTRTVTIRVPNEVRESILAAARAEGLSVSVWAGRRLRNNLKRTGRLAEARPQDLVGDQQTTGQRTC